MFDKILWNIQLMCLVETCELIFVVELPHLLGKGLVVVDSIDVFGSNSMFPVISASHMANISNGRCRKVAFLGMTNSCKFVFYKA